MMSYSKIGFNWGENQGIFLIRNFNMEKTEFKRN